MVSATLSSKSIPLLATSQIPALPLLLYNSVVQLKGRNGPLMFVDDLTMLLVSSNMHTEVLDDASRELRTTDCFADPAVICKNALEATDRCETHSE